MNEVHAHTLEAIFSHPMNHGLRLSDVEVLLKHLGIGVEHLSDHRLSMKAPSGATQVIHGGTCLHHQYLNEDGVLRLRRFLKQEGISPEHPIPEEAHPRGDQAKRLAIHLDHRGARLLWMEGNTLSTYNVRAHGPWSSHQSLSHRHDRDVAGQRATTDYSYLNQLSHAILEADRVLLIGHGHGKSDLRQILIDHLKKHHPGARKHIQTANIDDKACSDAEILAIARSHFGNAPHRKQILITGQENRED